MFSLAGFFCSCAGHDHLGNHGSPTRHINAEFAKTILEATLLCKFCFVLVAETVPLVALVSKGYKSESRDTSKTPKKEKVPFFFYA